MLRAQPGDHFLVAEVGTNHPGEVAELGGWLQPDVAVITCIGREHLEHFGDLRGVAQEEASILRLIPPDGKAFIESDAYAHILDVPDIKQIQDTTIYGWGALATPGKRQNLGEHQRFAISEDTYIDLPLIGPHDIHNALAAVEVGRSLGVGDDQIKAALESVGPVPGRLEVKHFGPVTVIDDTYNANPDSTLAALSVLVDFPLKPGGRRVAVLGDMLELGASADESHRELGRALIRLYQDDTIHQVCLIGPLMARAAEVLSAALKTDGLTHHPIIDDDTAALIADRLQPLDVALYKGSHGMELQRLLPAVSDRFPLMAAD